MWTHRLFVAPALAACLWSGCASTRGGSFSTRFVRPGTPAVDLGGPPLATSPARKTSKPAPEPRATSLGTSVEHTDGRLSSALLLETALPTVENHLRVAAEYRRLGILDASVDHLRLALQKEPRRADAYELLARVWRDWGLPDVGLGEAYRAAFYAPTSASAQNTLGTLLAALGESGDARRAYERALALDPTASWALNNLCELERRVGNQDAARTACEAALSLAPTMTAARNNLALVLAASGDLVGAREQFLKAGDEASANYNIGLVHLAAGQYAAAAAAFEQAIRDRPHFTAAMERAHATRLRLMAGGR